MQINVNTDNHIKNSSEFSEEISSAIEKTFNNYSKHITRVEVYFQDENKAKGGIDDKHCAIEVRLAGHQPLVSKHNANSIREAFGGASTKIKKIVKSCLEQDKEHR